MLKRIFGELPAWATWDNPLLRYELIRYQDKSHSRIGYIAVRVTILFLLILGGYLFATEGLQRNLQMPYTQDIWRILFFPALIIQVIMRVAGLSFGVGAVSDERQRQTWDNLRATEIGSDIGLRTRFVSIFHRMRELVFIVLLSRVILIVAILYEVTAFQGGYLDLLTARAVPIIPFGAGVIILSAFLTAFILMPLTSTGVDIAIGLLISTIVRNRAVSALMQVVVISFRVVSMISLTWLTWQFIHAEELSGGLREFLVLGAGGILADWGLLLSQLTHAGRLWTQIPYSGFLGLMMLLAVVIQTAIAGGILEIAVRVADFRE